MATSPVGCSGQFKDEKLPEGVYEKNEGQSIVQQVKKCSSKNAAQTLSSKLSTVVTKLSWQSSDTYTNLIKSHTDPGWGKRGKGGIKPARQDDLHAGE